MKRRTMDRDKASTSVWTQPNSSVIRPRIILEIMLNDGLSVILYVAQLFM